MKHNFKRKKYNLGVQAIGPRPTPPKRNVGKAATGALTGAASGAAAGAAMGVPGIIIGGAIGGITSLLKTSSENKANDLAYKNALQKYKEDSIANLQNKIADPSTVVQQQNQIAKNGIYETGSKEIEVEKDELVFTKANGKYVLKADFKDGKTHNKGGEEYKASEGDIIFPGKDRKKVLDAYNRKDYPKLEGMRVSLPKDTDTDNKAKKGLQGGPGDPINKKRKELDLKLRLQGLTTEEQIEFDSLGGLFPIKENKPLNSYINTISEDLNKNIGINPADKVFVNLPEQLKKRTQSAQEVITKDIIQPVNKNRQKKIEDPRIASRKRTDTPTIGIGYNGFANATSAKDVSIDNLNSIDPQKVNIPTSVPEVKEKFNTKLNNINLGAIAQLGAAATNLFPGEAEVQKTTDINLQKLKYRDTSESLRQDSKIAERIQRANARNLSGGNVSNMRANQRVAGIQNLKNQQSINSEEFRRAIGIANRNVGIVNKERLLNSQFEQQDEQVNAANRGARRNQVQEGIAQLGTIAGQIGADMNSKSAEAKLLETLNAMGYYKRHEDGSVTFGRNKKKKDGNK